jgi:hypothetical protein
MPNSTENTSKLNRLAVVGRAVGRNTFETFALQTLGLIRNRKPEVTCFSRAQLPTWKAVFMKVALAGLSLGVGLIACGCAPTVWDRPGTTPAEFSMDRAQCQLLAEGANPDPGVEPIYTGKVGTDIAANIGVGILHGIVQGAAVGHTFSLCMQAKGYVEVAPSAASGPPATAPVAAVPSPPVPLTSTSVTSLMPTPAVAPPPPIPMTPCGEDRPCGVTSVSVSP